MGSYVMAEAAEVCALPKAEAEALAQTGAKRRSNLLTGAMDTLARRQDEEQEGGASDEKMKMSRGLRTLSHL